MKKGFTLIELLLVIGIISVLAVVVFVALNPAQRFKDARDARRATDVESLLSAIHQSVVDSKGTIPTGINATEKQIVIDATATGCEVTTGGCGVSDTASCVNLNTDLAKFLKTMPIDPGLAATSKLTGYSVVADANGLITVRACKSEGTVNISASR
jgi:prepilin-type N-terminal cleavage/methylation domain-containing protein